MAAPLAEAHPRWTAVHQGEAMARGGLLIWPDLSMGGIVDSNPFHERRPHGVVAGVEISPRLLVERGDSLHRTDAYAAGDLRLYPDAPAANAIEGRAGVLHDWLIRPDLTVRLQAELDRRTDPFDTAAATAARRGLIFETDALAAGSVQKSFDQLFVVLSGTVLRAHFSQAERQGSLDRRLSDETVGTGKARVGYLFPSAIYVFAEPAANWRALDRLPQPSTGLRGVAGLGAARLGLGSGEVYAGVQRQDYPRPFAGTTAPVVGLRAAWSPRRAWTLSVEVERSLGQAEVATQADALGTPTRSDTAAVNLSYAVSSLWRAEAGAGAVWVDYLGTARRDRLVFTDLRIDYLLSRSFNLTGLVRVSAVRSTLAPASYGRTAATLAATYHY